MPVEGATYGLGQVVPTNFSCTDAGIGVDTCTGTDGESGQPLNTGSTGPKSFVVNATDVLGHDAAPVIVHYTVGGAAPLVTIDSVSKTTLLPTDSAAVTVTWHAGVAGTYSVRVLGGTDCATGTPVAPPASYSSGPVTTSVAASLFAIGPNVVRVCVTDSSGVTGSDTRTITRESLTGYIAFSRADRIWIIKPDGTGLQKITGNATDPKANKEQFPAISPDGSKIVFSRDSGGRQIWTIDYAGKNPFQLTTGPAGHDEPAWLPGTGAKIVFQSNRAGTKDKDIFVMNADGGSQVNITNLKGDDQSPTWSPDGSLIAFTSNRSGNFEIWTMTASGGAPTELTNDKKKDVDPTWSPDGSKIAFSSDRTAPGSGEQEIWMFSVSSPASLTRLTTMDQGDRAPYWFETSRIVFASQKLAALATVPPAAGATPTKIPNTTKDDKNPGATGKRRRAVATRRRPRGRYSGAWPTPVPPSSSSSHATSRSATSSSPRASTASRGWSARSTG